MKHYYSTLSIALIMIACQSQHKSQDEVKSIRSNDISELIRNPASADKPIDTTRLPKLVFDESVFDFGFVEEGDVVLHEFRFTNKGNIPLIISDAKSTCGCTVPEWPQTPIEPGEKGILTVRFNTAGKPKQQTKPISIFTNTYPNETKVYIKGFVNPKEES